MRPLLQIKLPREPRGLGVTAASGKVICPPRVCVTRIRERGGEAKGEGAVSLSLSLGEKRSWNQMPVALDTGFMVGRATTTLRSLQKVINLASQDRTARDSIFIDDTNRYLSLSRRDFVMPVVSCVRRIVAGLVECGTRNAAKFDR